MGADGGPGGGRVSWTATDLRTFEARGIAPAEADEQVQCLRDGFPPVALVRPATLGDGLRATSEADRADAVAAFDAAMAGGRIMKFVPASGAASRMFKSLLSIRSRGHRIDAGVLAEWHGTDDPDERECGQFLESLERFAFFDQLREALRRLGGDWPALRDGGDLHLVLDAALSAEDGLGLDALPKGLIPFHRYGSASRTAFEEHLVEGMQYARDAAGRVRLHCTVSPAHEAAIRGHLEGASRIWGEPGTEFELSYSAQSPATDTVALGPSGAPLRDSSGALVFRPGGHGALLENLAGLDGDLVLIKNVDNVVPDHQKPETVLYKKVLGGVLLQTQARIFAYLEELETGEVSESRLQEMTRFAEDDLCHEAPPGEWVADAGSRATALRRIFDRPLRVCGMVRNEGEPGGGPFWVRQSDGSVTLQIVEQAQVNKADASQSAIFRSSTHFNPVDLACALRDRRGRPYDLHEFRDPETGLVAVKSKDGQELRALELPGLWNGSMARWNTLFVEVPLSTFNPVKTVVDLLRPAHQGDPAAGA